MTTTAPSRRIETGIDTKVAFLRTPGAYAEVPAAVETRETHMSWVFLTDAFAWKLKKPVRHPFLDYRALARRRHFCEEELRLNRRLAPEVYLGVVPLLRRPDGTLRLGDAEPQDGEPVDWLVKMRRLPAARMLDAALEHGEARAAEVVRAADHLAAFFRAARPEAVGQDDYLGRFARELALNRATLHDGAYGLPHDAPWTAVIDTLDAFLAEDRDLLLRRLAEGCIVEGHGDLRPEHVYLGDPPAVIDCLEFDRALRLLDPFEELAFLAMECTLIPRGGWAGPLVLHRCATTLGRPPPGRRLLAFYTGFRACVRARLSVAHLQEPEPREPAKWRPRALRYLARAEKACATLRRRRSPPPAR
jgi:aminoglycoside phosphotransferase family enzyme